MKKIAGLFIVFGFLLAVPVLKLHAQKPFEGTITWNMTIPMLDDDKHEMIVNVKGDKTESEMDMGVQGLVKGFSDRSTKKIYLVMTAMKMGVTMDMKESTDTGSVDLKQSGQKETIAGHSADEYVCKGQKGDISIWVTSDMPKDMMESFKNYSSNNPQMDQNEKKAIKILLSKGLMPVRMVLKDAGETQMAMELVKFERKSLDDSLFVQPSDIKYNPMPAGMGAGGGNN